MSSAIKKDVHEVTYNLTYPSSFHKFHHLYSDLNMLYLRAVQIYFDKYVVPGLEEGHPKFDSVMKKLFEEMKQYSEFKKFYKATVKDMLRSVPTVLHRMGPNYTGGILIPVQFVKRPRPFISRSCGMRRDDTIECKYGKICIADEFRGIFGLLRLTRQIYNPDHWELEVEYFHFKRTNFREQMEQLEEEVCDV